MRNLIRTPLRSTLLLAGLLVSLAAFALTGPVSVFTGAFEGIDARLSWETSETGLQGFELSRRSGNDPTYQSLVTLQPNGTGRYAFLDQNLYKNNDVSLGTFTYKLTARTTSGDFNYSVTLSQTPSAVQRSWGSIKSMFR